MFSKGYIGKLVPCTPTFLGAFIQGQEKALKRAHQRGPGKGYKHRYPRGLETQVKRLRAIEVLRYRFKLGMNRIAETLGISQRTVKRDIQVFRESGAHKLFTIKGAYRRSKKSPGIRNEKGAFLSWKTLKRRLRAFILGLIDTIEEALGEDPP